MNNLPTGEGQEKPQLTIEMIKEELLRLDPNIGPEDFLAGQFLLSAIAVGTGYFNIAKFMGVKPYTVRMFWVRARRNGIFRGRKVRAEWLTENGAVALFCDILVVTGLANRGKE